MEGDGDYKEIFKTSRVFGCEETVCYNHAACKGTDSSFVNVNTLKFVYVKL